MLIVPHPDVVGRLIFLNKVELEDEGFRFGVGNNPFQIGDVLADEETFKEPSY